MTPVTHARGQTVALFGLGGSGLATARALKAGGARVIACDDSAAQMEKARSEDIEIADLREIAWSEVSSLILAPGVPLTHKDGKPFTHWTVELARANKVEIIGDIELFCRERRAIAPDAPFIAITGTNGKSTTTALIAHILREAGKDAQIGGNIGTAILSLQPPALDRFHVIECSSFQIDLAPSLDASVGVLLNVTPDHLDRHGTIADYAAIKERLVKRAHLQVVGIDDEFCRDIAARLQPSGLTRISAAQGADVFFRNSAIWRGHGGQVEKIADLSAVRSLRGAHNGQNAAAAAAALLACGLSAKSIAAGLASFPGLPHRLEEIGSLGPAIFVNDSKATNADSTEKALSSFDNGVFWILGGKSKEGGITPLKPYFGRIAKAYLIGAASDEFAATLDGAAPFERSETLDVAVASAARDVANSKAKEPVVLLSPACASYDQYPNFEVRGDHFRSLVNELPGFAPRRARL
ncbi:UDP-N-acetylmuramoyl-L-alanine--D-glutamate ligase [Terrarubrum flagellatum]|uniref:UDP-N-acetylmuramoyl-L-alanine--D-glutamate ligase n=1 Tax=Terrirubrum flagellatum TaxID=2895980 RepID=UPI003145206A